MEIIYSFKRTVQYINSILAADVTVTRAAGHNIRKIVFSVAFARGKTLK